MILQKIAKFLDAAFWQYYFQLFVVDALASRLDFVALLKQPL
jgi:hypothetical protein